MDSNKDDTPVFGMSILDIQKQEKEKERKAKLRNSMRKYLSQPGIKERVYKQRQAKNLTKTLKKLGKMDPHKTCKKLGHTIAWSRYNPGYSYKCTSCNVSYSDKESKHFYKGNKCPCCHRILRTRKTIAEKRKGDV